MCHSYGCDIADVRRVVFQPFNRWRETSLTPRKIFMNGRSQAAARFVPGGYLVDRARALVCSLAQETKKQYFIRNKKWKSLHKFLSLLIINTTLPPSSPYVFIDSCSAVFCLNFVLVVPFLPLSSPLPAHTWEVEYHVLFAVLSRLTSRLARYFYCCCDEGSETSATVLRPLHIALVLHLSAALQCICETRTSFNFNFTHHKWAITIGARLHLHFLSILSRKILFQAFFLRLLITQKKWVCNCKPTRSCNNI